MIQAPDLILADEPVASLDPVLAHSIERFSRIDGIERIILALPDPEDLNRYLGGAASWPVPVLAVAGGQDRQASVSAALQEVGDVELVLVHDGVRPLVPADVVRAVQRAAAVVGASVACARCGDTVKEVAGGRVKATRDRDRLWLAQTPQGFRLGVLQRAHRQAEADGHRGTDDAALVERLGLPVAVVESPRHNMKITTGEDLAVAEALLLREQRP